VALGKGVFADPAVPSALCPERNMASTESNVLSTKPWNPVVNVGLTFPNKC
jgi:hypothetical protein